MKSVTSLMLLLVLVSVAPLRAQDEGGELGSKVEEVKSQIDGIDENLKEIQGIVSGLKKTKVSGYLQVNFEKSEGMGGFGADPYDGKDIVNSRFRLRRSRIKVTYSGSEGRMVVQGDYGNSGFELKDAYLEFEEPWSKMFAFRFGVFNRPVYEVEYSSSQRESPERSVVIRALYPGERDLGAMVTYANDDLFKLQLAAFNNTFKGTYSQSLPNFGNEPLYFVGRITTSLTLGDVGLDIGAHARFGSVRANTNKIIASDSPTAGNGMMVDSTSTKIGDGISRSWFGVEAQLYYDFLGGMKILAEYLTGSDVNELSASGAAMRERDFSGFYAMLVKNIGTEFQCALKYDSYSPNTAISSDAVNLTSELTKSTVGLGLHNYSFSNVRLTLWYDMITTKTNDRILKSDPKDNLLTFRAQYKF